MSIHALSVRRPRRDFDESTSAQNTHNPPSVNCRSAAHDDFALAFAQLLICRRLLLHVKLALTLTWQCFPGQAQSGTACGHISFLFSEFDQGYRSDLTV